jgi:RluA family pseudouridine synthase
LSAACPELQVLYWDRDVLAIDKPAGLLTVPDRWDKDRENLMGLLFEAIREQRAWVRDLELTHVSNAHRLDAGTSGVLLLARHKAALVNLARQFREQHPRKTYVALVQGAPPKEEFDVSLRILPHPFRRGLSIGDRLKGKEARTRFKVLERFRGHALIEAEPGTGRLHQIRVHLKESGCPLVADPDYGSGQPLLLSGLKRHYKMKAEGERPLMGRPALHAARLEVLHPATGAPLVIEAPWPKDLTVAVKYLRKFAAFRGRCAVTSPPGKAPA